MAGGAQLRQAFTLLGVEAVVEADSTCAVVGQAVAGAGVEVFTVVAASRCAQARAADVIEVLSLVAFAGNFNASAGTFLAVPDRVVFLLCAVRWRLAASAAGRVPVGVGSTSVVAGGRRAGAVADFFVPVVARRAEMRMAEASALVSVVHVGSPVLRMWADLRSADTGADIGVPRKAFTASLGLAYAGTQFAVEDSDSASIDMLVAFALAVALVKIIINII